MVLAPTSSVVQTNRPISGTESVTLRRSSRQGILSAVPFASSGVCNVVAALFPPQDYRRRTLLVSREQPDAVLLAEIYNARVMSGLEEPFPSAGEPVPAAAQLEGDVFKLCILLRHEGSDDVPPESVESLLQVLGPRATIVQISPRSSTGSERSLERLLGPATRNYEFLPITGLVGLVAGMYDDAGVRSLRLERLQVRFAGRNADGDGPYAAAQLLQPFDPDQPGSGFHFAIWGALGTDADLVSDSPLLPASPDCVIVTARSETSATEEPHELLIAALEK